MKDIPYRSRGLLADLAEGMPEQPYLGSRAIARFLSSNFVYGADENINQRRWVRWPHQAKRVMNCQDAAIFGFLLTRELGLDSTLLRFEDFDGTSQPHLATLIGGSRRDYLLSNVYVDAVRLRDGHLEENGRKVDFSSVQMLDIPDLLAWFKESKLPGGATRFVMHGQGLSKYFDMGMYVSTPWVYAVHRFFKIQDGCVFYRKSYELPGYFFNLEIGPDGWGASVSAGINNLVPVDNIPVGGPADGGLGSIIDSLSKRNQERLRKVVRDTYIAMFNMELMVGELSAEQAVSEYGGRIDLAKWDSLDPEEREIAIRFSLVKDFKRELRHPYYNPVKCEYTRQGASPWSMLVTQLLDVMNPREIKSPRAKKRHRTVGKLEAMLKEEGIQSDLPI